MEKFTPHFKLAAVKTLVRVGKVAATKSAAMGASAVGVESLHEMSDVVLSLTTADFYKSMTTHRSHRIWQDVYHGKTAGGVQL